MSPRQAQIVEFIRHYKDENGYLPTVREIQEEVGLASPSTVHGHLERCPLARKVQIGKNTWRWDVD